MTYLILIIEDDHELTHFLQDALQTQGYKTLVAYSGREGLRAIETWSPNLVILDLSLPDIDGFDVCQRIREQDHRLPILILTGRTETANRVKGLNLGADDYLVKPFDLDELLARVSALLRRAYESPARVLRFMDLVFNTESLEVRRGKRVIQLTPKESELLRMFMEHPRQVLSRERLYREVWGYPFTLGSNVLDVYIRYLRRKLEAHGEPRLIYTVRGVGYILREPEPEEHREEASHAQEGVR